jgi:cobalt/nickel transport system permease protein
VHHAAMDRWSRKSSVLHTLDARAKIAVLLVFLVMLSLTQSENRVALALDFALLLTGVVASGLPVHKLLPRAGIVLPFSATFAAMSWLAGDHARALALLEKTYLSALAVLLVVSVTPLPALLDGLRWLRVPRLLLTVMQFLYRYLFVISEQAQHMRLAAAARRGLGRARRSQFQFAGGALAVLFARSHERAAGIHRAMLARGYQGKLSVLPAKPFLWSDAAFAVCVTALCLLIRIL